MNREEELKYEFEKLMAIQAMSDSFWEDAAIPAIKIVETAWRGLAYQIITWETARRKLLEYQWPATWKEAFKERWFPRWAKKRWPIYYRKIEVSELAAIKRGSEDKVRYFIEEETKPI